MYKFERMQSASKYQTLEGRPYGLKIRTIQLTQCHVLGQIQCTNNYRAKSRQKKLLVVCQDFDNIDSNFEI